MTPCVFLTVHRFWGCRIMAEKYCFVCDEEADTWLPRLDVWVCSEQHMKIVLEEWVKETDPLERNRAEREAG